MDRTSFKESFRSFAFEGWTSYVCITTLLLTLLAVLGLGIGYIIKNRADQMTQSHLLVDKQVECSVAGGKDKIDFVNSQRNQIITFGNSHRYEAIRFFSFFYTSYVLFTIFGLIAAISLAVITKKGIDVASDHLITVFLVCTSIVLLYQGASSVFQLKANLDVNANLAVSYAVLTDQIDTYCSTGKVNVNDPNEAFAAAVPKLPAAPTSENSGVTATSTATPQTSIRPFYVEPNGDQFINYVAWRMEHLRSLSIAIDETKETAIDNKRFLLK